MKKILIALVTFTSLSVFAEWKTTTYSATVSTQAEAEQIISAINSGRINVFGCGGQQQVYAYSFNNNSGSYVKAADGSFRPVRSKASFKVRCQE